MAKTTCTGCGIPKAAGEFYESNPTRCKKCLSEQTKARRATAGKSGGGGARPKSTAPAAATKVTGAKGNGATTIEDLAVIHIPAGFRLGPLHKTTAGLVHMPYYVDLSFGQLDELATLRKGLKE